MEDVKQAVMDYGAVGISYYAYTYSGFASNQYYNADTAGYYCYDEQTTNHAVTVVGWDDDYPAQISRQHRREMEHGQSVTAGEVILARTDIFIFHIMIKVFPVQQWHLKQNLRIIMIIIINMTEVHLQ